MKKIPFNVSARTALLIGRQNFANAEGAIIELVKNCYDADAKFAIVFFDLFRDSIFIIDNGEGMTEDIIEKNWMTIGTDVKELNFRGTGKRIKSGAKGIGRFALDRLGKTCKLISQTNQTSTVEWIVSWESFEKPGSLITDINATLSNIPNTNIKALTKSLLGDIHPKKLTFLDDWGENKGTIIEINGLKDTWRTTDLLELFNNLSILTPPENAEEFSIFLFSSIEPEKYGQIAPIELDDFDYRLNAIVEEDQTISITLWRNELDPNGLKKIGFFEQSKLQKLPQYSEDAFFQESVQWQTSLSRLVKGLNEDGKNNLSEVGPFSFDFYFIRKAEGRQIKYAPYKQTIGRDSWRSDWLDQYGGIKIFRDGFRVRPYGEVRSNSFDWLDLGSKALKNPTVTKPGYGVRPYQVYGIVNISRVLNPGFQDKSSREGIQENEVFLIFKQIITELIGIFEKDRNHIMMLVKEISDIIDKKEKAKKRADALAEQRKEQENDKSNNEKQTLSDEDVESLFKAREADKEEIEDLREEQKLLRSLASTGLIVSTFVHELTGLTNRILPRTDDLKFLLKDHLNQEKIDQLPDFLNPYTLLDDMRNEDIRLKNWLDFALSSIKKDKRQRKKINLVEYLVLLERAWKSLFERLKIKLTINTGNYQELMFRGFEIDLDSIFNNLFANSIDAFILRKDGTSERNIILSFSQETKRGLSINYQDSGPGLSLDISDPYWIFEPFNTTKVNPNTGEKIGTGLGMWILKSIVDEYKGEVDVIKTRPEFSLNILLPLAD